MKTLLLAQLFMALPGLVTGQGGAAPDSARGVPRFGLEGGPVALAGVVRPWAYLGDQGREGALRGDEAGTFDVWTGRVKLLRDLQLAFKVEGEEAPIEGRSLARNVVTRAEGVTITYSHSSFTVRQHLFVPVAEAGVIMLLEVETVRPLEVFIRVLADLAGAGLGGLGAGTITWQADQRRFLITREGGQNALLGSPMALGGTAPAVFGGSTVPAQFLLRFTPSQASPVFIPVIMAGGAAPRDSVERIYRRLLTNPEQYWREKVSHYRRLRQRLLSMESPDLRLNQAFDWAKVNLEQESGCNPDQGCGLAAGFGRAGFVNSVALSAIGQFDLVRAGLLPMALDQRVDGKIGDDTSGEITLHWLVACYAYWQATGDDGFLRQIWPKLTQAFRWASRAQAERHGSDIRLAGIWVAGLEGVQAMAAVLQDEAVRAAAGFQQAKAQEALESKFWMESAGRYGSALVQAGGDSARLEGALTALPAIAMSFGLLDARRSGRMLREIGSSALTTDWGARLLSRYDPRYDPLHHSQGAVQPSVTGFVALAHYRYHRGWAGHDLVRDLARATFDFGRGRTPEQFSGAYYTLMGTSAPEFFASPALVNPLVRGLLGIEVDAPNHSVAIEPHLPAEWNGVSVNDVWVGRDRVHMTVRRSRGKYAIALRRTGGGAPLFVRLSPALPLGSEVDRVLVGDSDAAVQVEETAHDVHPVIEVQLVAALEVVIDYRGGLEVMAPTERLEVGDGSTAVKILDFRKEQREFMLLVEGEPGSIHTLNLRPGVRVRAVVGADVVEQTEQRLSLRVRFNAGPLPVRREIRLRT